MKLKRKNQLFFWFTNPNKGYATYIHTSHTFILNTSATLQRVFFSSDVEIEDTQREKKEDFEKCSTCVQSNPPCCIFICVKKNHIFIFFNFIGSLQRQMLKHIIPLSIYKRCFVTKRIEKK